MKNKVRKKPSNMGIKNVSSRQEQAFPCLQMLISGDLQSQKILCAYLRSAILLLHSNMVELITQIIQRSMKLNCQQVNVTLNALFQKIICSYTEDVLPCLPVNTVVVYFLDTAPFPAIKFVTQFLYHSDYTDMQNTQ